MVDAPVLLPMPRQFHLTEGEFVLVSGEKRIALAVPRAASLVFSAQSLQTALRGFTGQEWAIAGGAVPASIVFMIDASLKAQGYKLVIGDKVSITGGDEAGVFYGVQTLIQLLQTYGSTLPRLEAEDYPDFPVRGIMLDISRDRVPTMNTLIQLIDLLASWKINQLQLYTEHTFAYSAHELVWKDASPLTAQDILELDAYCRQRHIDLVPNQNSFGHMHRWLKHSAYSHLAETETGAQTPWGYTFDHPFSLSPAAEETIPFVSSLFDELLPNFSSNFFNIGGDETFDLGMGRSADLVEELGKGWVYLDFLLKIYEQVKARGRTMMFWGDIINQYPKLVAMLPKDVIALEWGYEANHDFPGKSELFAQSGIPFYVCPGTSSWNALAGRTDNMIGNIRSAIENGLKYGAIGVLNTDWGDRGHWQPLPVSYAGYAYGAALSWAYEANRDLDLPTALSRYAFRDSAGLMGKLFYDLGNTYQKLGIDVHNGTPFFWAYSLSLEEMRGWREQQTTEGRAILDNDEELRTRLENIVAEMTRLMEQVDASRPERSDADILKREFRYAARLIRHGSRLMLAQLGSGEAATKEQRLNALDEIEAEARALWLSRSEIGGMSDSLERFKKARQMHQQFG